MRDLHAIEQDRVLQLHGIPDHRAGADERGSADKRAVSYLRALADYRRRADIRARRDLCALMRENAFTYLLIAVPERVLQFGYNLFYVRYRFPRIFIAGKLPARRAVRQVKQRGYCHVFFYTHTDS